MRQPGIEIADKTEKLPLPNSAVRILRRTPLAPLRKGSCRRSRLRGRFFRGARTLLPIRLLRCPDRSLTAKPVQRATDGRPYELKSVPTKTLAIRTTGNCAILVQKFCVAPHWLPCVRGAVGVSRLRGRKRRQPHRLVRKRPSHLPLHRGGKRARRLSSAPCLPLAFKQSRLRDGCGGNSNPCGAAP